MVQITKLIFREGSEHKWTSAAGKTRKTVTTTRTATTASSDTTPPAVYFRTAIEISRQQKREAALKPVVSHDLSFIRKISLGHIRKQRYMTGALYRDRELPLVGSADTCHTAREDL